MITSNDRPARRMGCLIPKSLVSGVEMVAMVNEDSGVGGEVNSGELRQTRCLLSSDSVNVRVSGCPAIKMPVARCQVIS